MVTYCIPTGSSVNVNMGWNSAGTKNNVRETGLNSNNLDSPNGALVNGYTICSWYRSTRSINFRTLTVDPVNRMYYLLLAQGRAESGEFCQSPFHIPVFCSHRSGQAQSAMVLRR